MLRHEIAWELPGEPALSDLEVGRAIDEALRQGGDAEFGVGVVFVDDGTLASMHARHLDDPGPTDVITFDLRSDESETRAAAAGPKDARGPDVELYVSVDRAREVAAERGVDLKREITLYVVHGVLHLVGYDDGDMEDRRRMRRAEDVVMGRLGFAPDC